MADKKSICHRLLPDIRHLSFCLCKEVCSTEFCSASFCSTEFCSTVMCIGTNMCSTVYAYHVQSCLILDTSASACAKRCAVEQCAYCVVQCKDSAVQ